MIYALKLFFSLLLGSSISRRIRGRSMYSIPRGDDEFANLVSRPATSAPTAGLYQNDDPLLNYGTIATGVSSGVNIEKTNRKEFVHI